MAGVDNRIVTMQFNNSQFEQGARTTLSTLGKLKESMNFGAIVGGTVRGLGTIESALSKLGLKTPFSPMIRAANTGLSGIGTVLDKLGMKNPFTSGVQGASELQRAAQAAGGPQGMGYLEGGVTAVSGKFIALTTIAVTALSTITNKAISSTTAWLKSFTLAPIQQGLSEYETNLKSIQVVQANTDRPLPEINAALDQLNKYSDQTIYNFSEMAKNVGTFTAAGVDLETSVSSIKGIANMAALSGSSSEQAAGAMYQLSQAIAAGKVGLMDWNSVVNAGMGGKKLQNALAQTAIAMGDIDAAQVKGVKSGEQLTIMGKSFRESIMAAPGQESWLTGDILTKSLASLDGRYSEVALSQERLKDGTLKYKNAAEVTAAVDKARAAAAKDGIKYTEEQFKALQELSDSAFKSATEVKTLGQVFDVAKEAIGSGWSASFRNIFGNLDEAKKVFTGMSNGLNEIINANALARNTLLAKWKKMGGRDTIIDGLKEAWEGFYDVVKAVGEGFRDVFPATTAKGLLDMSRRFEDLMHTLLPSKETLKDITDISRGFFSILDIGKQIIVGVWQGLKTMFDTVGAGNGDFLGFVASIANAITRFDEFLKESGLITTFFETLGRILSVPLSLLKGLGDIITGIFGGFDEGAASKVGDAVDSVGDRLSGLEVVGERLRDFFSKVGDFFGNLGQHIANALMGIGDVVAGAFTADTFGQTLDVINTTLLGALVLLIRNFFNKGVNIDLSGGLFDGIKETLGEATGAFENMQNTLKADILMKLAGAIAVMAGALLVLSMIDPASLTKALIAMSTGFGILIGALAALMKFLGAAGLVQMYVVTSAMTKMAASILLMAFALKVLANISFGDMMRGVVGLAAVMHILTKAMLPLAAGSKGMAKATFSMILLGIAINILAIALKIFATMSWEEMIKGLAGLAGTLAVLVLAMKAMPDLQAEAIGLVALGVAMNLLAIAMKIFATMSWEEMLKGLVGIGGALFIISAAINTMPKTMMLQAVALVAVAGAMVILAGALQIMASMGWEEIAKGMVVMGGAMLIMALGLNAIGPMGLIGAVGLLAAAAAMAIMAPVLLAFGAMSWEAILKGLVMLAGVFTVLGVAAAVLTPLLPVILGLGAALLIIGAGLALAGAGAFLAATAFTMVVAAGAAGIQILVGLLDTIIAAIPPALKAFGEGVVQFAVAIGNGAPEIAKAFGKILMNMLDQVRKAIPKIKDIVMRLIDMVATVISQGIPKLYRAGVEMVLGILRALADNIGKIVDQGVRVVVNFLNGVARNIDDIIQAGVNLVLKFMQGVAKAIRDNGDDFGRAGADIGLAIVEGTVEGIGAASQQVIDKLVSLAKDAWEAAKDFLGIGSPSKLFRDTVGKRIPEGMALGVRDGSGQVVSEMGKMGKSAVAKVDEVMKGVNDALAIDPNMNPTVTPVLDLTHLTKEANKMSSILATAPIVAGVSYQTATDISAMTTASNEPGDGPDDPSDGNGGRGDISLTIENHSPKPIDSVETYRSGKTLVSLMKEALS